jgi:hypothetical protein
MRSKLDVWTVSVTISAGAKAFSNNIATITYSDQFGQTQSSTKVQIPFGYKIKDVVFASAPTPDVYIIVDKNNGLKQWTSVPASQLVLQAGKPRLDPFGKDAMGRKIVPAFIKYDILSIIVRPLADVSSNTTITFQLYIEYA